MQTTKLCICGDHMHANYCNEKDEYDLFLKSIKTRFDSTINAGFTKLFYTTTHKKAALFDIFLNALPAEARQHYNCSTCRSFVYEYGDLVAISETGALYSALWCEGSTPKFFKEAVKALRQYVELQKVAGLFTSSKTTLGTPVTEEWYHMSVEFPYTFRYRSTVTQQDFKMLIGALCDYSMNAVEVALKMVRSESLYRGNVISNQLEWFHTVLTKWNAPHVSYTYRNNLVWKMLAEVSPSYCHIKNGMLGSLLDDISAGMNIDIIKSRFNAKMDPTQYQRPQAAPEVGNIKELMKYIEENNFDNSFARRFATIDDLKSIWKPEAEVVSSHINTASSILDSMIKSKSTPLFDSAIYTKKTMGWVKFRDTILPMAKRITLNPMGLLMATSTFLTANDPDSKPIFKWDSPELRNTVSYYLYINTHLSPSQFNISADCVDVTAIVYDPEWWNRDPVNADDNELGTIGITFILKGAKDKIRYENMKGIAVFPEDLKPEFHPFRKSIEALSGAMELSAGPEPSATGMRFQRGINYGKSFELTVCTETLGNIKVILDRWD